MAADKRTTVRLSEKLLRRARRTLKASTNEDAVTKALHESFINREIHATLKDLIRKGCGRFVEPVVRSEECRQRKRDCNWRYA